MDTAYDRIQEEALPAEASPDDNRTNSNNLNTELQEAFQAVTASPWGATLGGWLGQVRKQGESLYQELQKEASEASTQATKGLSSLREQVVSRVGAQNLGSTSGAAEKEGGNAGDTGDKSPPVAGELSQSNIVKEAGQLVASLRSTAAAKLQDLQRAEDAADEALLKFGLNVRNFLRDAVTIIAPEDDEFGGPGGVDKVLFETKDRSGKKIFHSTRFDAQLHAIHSSKSYFTMDPSGPEWKQWESNFDIDAQKESITKDLEKYPELLSSFEWAVPERADYKVFWTRYYFLRKAIDEEERRRKDVLKGKLRGKCTSMNRNCTYQAIGATADTEEEVGWDDDDEDEDEDEKETAFKPGHKASESTTTLNAPAANISSLLKPNQGRRSDEEKRSVADSDASYDLMSASGTTSRATGSPKLEASKTDAGKDDDDDDDWE